MRLLIATHNKGKLKEYKELLKELPLELVSLEDLGVTLSVEETGSTFVENALLKARAYAKATGLVTVADDSGLEVDALGGAPGIHSARYGGPGLSDRERFERLLDAMKDIPPSKRTARFRCVIAVAWPDSRCAFVEGTCEGAIAREPRGEHGFGYDPVFYLPEYGRTMAELPPEVKNQISHRAAAARDLVALLKRCLEPANG